MRSAPVCPRCGEPVRPPGAWSSLWTCAVHGPVDPLQPAPRPNAESVAALAERATVPVWLPWPLPDRWLVTGIRWAGDERTGTRAVALACSGPAPLGGVGELLLVSEELGVGLGAGLAGLAGDPGADVFARAADAKLLAAGHPTPLWSVESEAGCSVLVGEARGTWLWAVFWPAESDLLAEGMTVVDLTGDETVPDLPIGALSPRLVPWPLP